MDIRRTEHPLLNGEYWIDPEGNGNPMKVYCDMTTHGGNKRIKSDFIPCFVLFCVFF